LECGGFTALSFQLTTWSLRSWLAREVGGTSQEPGAKTKQRETAALQRPKEKTKRRDSAALQRTKSAVGELSSALDNLRVACRVGESKQRHAFPENGKDAR
jgi:hypothetical protein